MGKGVAEMKSRIGEVSRHTSETKVTIRINMDGTGKQEIHSGIGFFDHMLEQIAKHGRMDLSVQAEGDLHVDDHHTVEDVGIVMGQAIREALEDKASIVRYACVHTPMDEALSRVTLDLSGRPYLHFDVAFQADRTGNFEVQLVREFFRAVAQHAGITLHITTLYGANDHHIIETIFKAFGRAMDEATVIDQRINGPLSTKGSLSDDY
ncbi:imidazoleglycerol-phosphate dehydratase [Tindallia magadiensis]|uniref:Imidazoleglycerol-phosphate dehydratase n=2 Tax=Tindallia magadiensis TaxID=69895 RepID=A0A1I3DWN3_9FIRM|nr:imidazoleglycerol-phosphate dehydratase [Tindallia magadiensis]